eukprot:856801-Amphidinium_carterae.3
MSSFCALLHLFNFKSYQSSNKNEKKQAKQSHYDTDTSEGWTVVVLVGTPKVYHPLPSMNHALDLLGASFLCDVYSLHGDSDEWAILLRC